MHNFWKLKTLLRRNTNSLTYFYLYNTLHINAIMGFLSVKKTFVLYIMSSKLFNDFDYIIEDVYKQMPVIVTYYLADKFVNLFDIIDVDLG